jgi:cytochrome c551
MKKMWIAGLIAGSAVLLAACGSNGNEPNQSGQVTEGPEKVYMQHCANCHGEQLQGGYGPALKEAGKKYSEAEILTIIQKGKGNMPSQGFINEEDQKMLAKWLSEQ